MEAVQLHPDLLQQDQDVQGLLESSLVEESFAEAIEGQQGSVFTQRLKVAYSAGKTVLKSAVVAAELLPVTNEGIRFGAFAYTQTQTHNPVVGAAVLGGMTMLIEGAGAVAASDWIAKDRVKDVIDSIDKRLADSKLAFLNPKRYIPERLKVSPVAEAGIAMTLGTVAVLELKQREDPTRTTVQNMRHGLFTAGWLSSVFAAEGALVSEGIQNYTSPTTVGTSLLGLAGVMSATRWVKKKLTNFEEDPEVQ